MYIDSNVYKLNVVYIFFIFFVREEGQRLKEKERKTKKLDTCSQVAFRMHKLYNLCTMHKFVHKTKRRTAGGWWGQR